MFHMNFVHIAELIDCHFIKFLKDIQKIILSETINGMKVKLHIHVYDIGLFITSVFIIVAHNTVSHFSRAHILDKNAGIEHFS